MAYTNGLWTRGDLGSSGQAGLRSTNPNPAQVWEETITFTSQTTDFTSSEIDFVPAGIDFTVWLEQANTMSVGGDIVLQGSIKSGGTFVTMGTVVNNFAASAAGGDFNSGVANQDSIGDAPFYKLLGDMDGPHSGETTNGTAKFYLVYSPKPAR